MAKGTMLLIGVGKPKPGMDMGMGKKPMDESDEEADATKEGRIAAVKALFKAVKANDVEAGAEALHTYVELCAQMEHSASDKEEEDY